MWYDEEAQGPDPTRWFALRILDYRRSDEGDAELVLIQWLPSTETRGDYPTRRSAQLWQQLHHFLNCSHETVEDSMEQLLEADVDVDCLSEVRDELESGFTQQRAQALLREFSERRGISLTHHRAVVTRKKGNRRRRRGKGDATEPSGGGVQPDSDPTEVGDLDLARKLLLNSCDVCAGRASEYVGSSENPATPVVLVFGGTFLPPHVNHARLLAAARRSLEESHDSYFRREEHLPSGEGHAVLQKEYGFRVLGGFVMPGHRRAAARKFGELDTASVQMNIDGDNNVQREAALDLRMEMVKLTFGDNSSSEASPVFSLNQSDLPPLSEMDPTLVAEECGSFVRVDDWLETQDSNRGMSLATQRLEQVVRATIVSEYGRCGHFPFSATEDTRHESASLLSSRVVFMSCCGADALPRLRSAYDRGVVCISNRPVDFDLGALYQSIRAKHRNVFLFSDDAPVMSSTEIRRLLSEVASSSGRNILERNLHPAVLKMHLRSIVTYPAVNEKKAATRKQQQVETPSSELPLGIDACAEAARVRDEGLRGGLVERLYDDLTSIENDDCAPDDFLGEGVAGRVERRFMRNLQKSVTAEFKPDLNLDEGSEVAVKFVHLSPSGHGKPKAQKRRCELNIQHIERECEIYGVLEAARAAGDGDRARNVLRCLGVGAFGPTVFVVLELMSTSLKEFANQRRVRTDQRVFPGSLWGTVIADIARGLAFLSECRVLHRDLTVANILVSTAARGQVRACIADWGTAKLMDDVRKIPRGSCRHYPPEGLTSNTNFTPASDVFMFSFLCWEIAHGSESVWGSSVPTAEVVRRTLDGERPPMNLEGWEFFWHPAFADIVRRCWEPLPANRPDAYLLTRQCDSALQTILK